MSKTVDNAGLHAAYVAVHHSISRIHGPSFPWTSVSEMVELTLVGMNDFYAKAVLAFRDRHPGRNKFRRPDIANQEVEELYIYPPVTKRVDSPEHCESLRINIGTGAAPEFVDFGKVPLVTILCDSAGSSKVAIVGGGKPQRMLEGEEAQRFIAHFDAIRKQMQ